jgi:hypothetical protein
MITVRSIIANAVEEVIREAPPLSSRKVTNRVIKRLAENKACIAEWVAELGVLKFVGYVNRKKPTTVRDMPYARDNVAVYMPQESD